MSSSLFANIKLKSRFLWVGTMLTRVAMRFDGVSESSSGYNRPVDYGHDYGCRHEHKHGTARARHGTSTSTGTGKPRGLNQAMQTRDSPIAGDRRKLEIQSDCRQERIAV
jgi:hypothetical protein